jgi:hypothetical protein
LMIGETAWYNVRVTCFCMLVFFEKWLKHCILYINACENYWKV